MEDNEEEHGRCIQRRFLSSGYFIPTVGLVVVHIIMGSFSVMIGYLLSAGVDPLFLVFVNNLTTFVFLSPFAAFFERHKWPERLGTKLAVHLVLLSMGGVTAFQILGLMGMQRTSPAITSAMSNLSPGLVFLIACFLRLEKFNANCRYSIAKAIGTLVCLCGVIAMTVLQKDGKDNVSTSRFGDVGIVDMGPSQEWIIGCAYLFSAVLISSCNTILQSTTLGDLPAPLSLTAITSLLGAVFTAPIQLLINGKLDTGKYTTSTTVLVSCILMSSIVMSMCLAFTMWCIGKQGPVFVSIFSPIGIVTSAILSALVLGKFLSPASIVGVLLIIIGLYTVLWARRKECHLPMLVIIDNDTDFEENEEVKDGMKKPMLS